MSKKKAETLTAQGSPLTDDERRAFEAIVATTSDDLSGVSGYDWGGNAHARVISDFIDDMPDEPVRKPRNKLFMISGLLAAAAALVVIRPNIPFESLEVPSFDVPPASTLYTAGGLLALLIGWSLASKYRGRFHPIQLLRKRLRALDVGGVVLPVLVVAALVAGGWYFTRTDSEQPAKAEAPADQAEIIPPEAPADAILPPATLEAEPAAPPVIVPDQSAAGVSTGQATATRSNSATDTKTSTRTGTQTGPSGNTRVSTGTGTNTGTNTNPGTVSQQPQQSRNEGNIGNGSPPPPPPSGGGQPATKPQTKPKAPAAQPPADSNRNGSGSTNSGGYTDPDNGGETGTGSPHAGDDVPQSGGNSEDGI
ncbi:hypothetical protein KY386_00640 [Candidatus Parcubacteria bacterium]|nr:hypothetical protein [Candidatus Parcubacteria bacterium]